MYQLRIKVLSVALLGGSVGCSVDQYTKGLQV